MQELRKASQCQLFHSVTDTGDYSLAMPGMCAHVRYQAAQKYFGKSKFWGEKTFWEKEDKQVPQADKMSSCHRCHFICFFHKLRREKKKKSMQTGHWIFNRRLDLVVLSVELCYRRSQVDAGASELPAPLPSGRGHAENRPQRQQAAAAQDEGLECGGAAPGGGREPYATLLPW